MTMDSAAPPPTNPFSTVGNDDYDDDDDDDINDNGDNENDFDAFSLYPTSSADGGGASSSVMPSLQSIQREEQMMILRQQEHHQQQSSFVSLSSPDDLRGPMDNNAVIAARSTTNNWPTPPPTAATSTATAAPQSTTSSINEPSFLSNLLTCGIILHLVPYFNVDTSDIFFRMKATFRYCLVNDGFRNEVLYSIVKTRNTTAGEEEEGVELAHRSETTASTATKAAASAEKATKSTNNTSSTISTPTTIRKIGPDLYGPTWITLTLVFFVAVSSNMSLYIHHYHQQRQIQLSNIVDEGGVAAEEEWDYDINQLLRATSILYSFSFGLPTVLYLLLRLMGGNNNSNPANNLGLADLICLYGYSLVPYLPVTWICILPYNWVQWTILGVATLVSGMLVLRNVVGSILESSRSGGGGGLGGGGMQGKSGGLIMCLVGCHLVFFLVLKLAFYHHRNL